MTAFLVVEPDPQRRRQIVEILEGPGVRVAVAESGAEALTLMRQDAIDCAIKEGVGKFGGKIPPKGALKLPLRDGDTERDDDNYKGCFFINANSKTAPQIVDKHVRPILDRSEVYSGVYAHVSLSFYVFNTNKHFISKY